MSTSLEGAFRACNSLPSANDADTATRVAEQLCGDHFEVPLMATTEMLSRLPALDDDDLVGVTREHVVRRDDRPDIKFIGKLIASSAPDAAPKWRWKELRVHQTTGGKYVFSEIGRSALEGERDKFLAVVFDPSNPRESWSETRLYGAETWENALVKFFEYTDLAKRLYKKLGVETEERLL